MTHASQDLPGRITTPVDTSANEIDLGKIFGVLWRGKLWIALVTCIAIAIGTYYVIAVATPMYTTRAAVALESRQEQVVDIESVVSGLPGDQAAINTELEVLRSRRLIEKVVIDLGLVQDPEFNATLREPSGLSLGGILDWVRQAILGPATEDDTLSDQALTDAVVDTLLANVSVSNVRQSYVFRISVVSEDPAKAAQIANRLAELYIEDQIVLKFEKTVQATEWLTERVAELQMELETAENRLKEFGSNTDLISPEGLIALNRQLKDLRDRQSDMSATARAATERVQQLVAAQQTNDIERMITVADSRDLDRLRTSDGASQPTEAFRSRYNAILARAELEQDRSEAQLAAIEMSIDEISQSITTQSDELVQLQQLQQPLSSTERYK